MTITKTTEFKNGSADQYRVSLPRDFAVLSSDQDAWYYGCWASAQRRVLFFYAEGDCTTIECTTDTEFTFSVLEWARWSERMGYKPALKLREEQSERWEDLGLEDLMARTQSHGYGFKEMI